MTDTIKTSLIVDLEGNLTQKAERFSRSVNDLSRTANRGFSAMSSGVRASSQAVDSWGNRAVIASGAAAYAFNRSFISTAATFEKFEAVLKVVEGSSEKAKASMDWVTDFASTTPYELAEVTDAFVKLKAYGIDPQAGALKSAGDAAAALGRPLEQAVEAMADAMTGENERLKAFGITSETRGDKIRYSWQQNGKEMTAVVNKNSKAQIQAQLMAIWNSKYAGAMDELSKAWMGLTSNLSDKWTVFAKDVMTSGAFDLAKQQLDGLLQDLDKMKETGEYDQLVETIGTNLVDAFKGVGDAVHDIKEFGADAIGVYQDLTSVIGNITGSNSDAVGPNALDQPAQDNTREMTANIIKFLGGIYLLNKTLRLLSPLLKGSGALAGALMRRNKIDAAGASVRAQPMSGIKLPMPVYVVNDRMSLMPDEMGGGPELPDKKQPQKRKAGKLARAAETAVQGAQRAGNYMRNSPKGTGLATAGISAAYLVPTLLEQNVSTEDKVTATAETVGGGAGAWAGAAAGAALGSFIPVVGTAIGGLIGGAMGWAAGEWAGGKAAEAINKNTVDLTIKLEGAPGTKAEVTGMRSSSDSLTSNVYYGQGMR